MALTYTETRRLTTTERREVTLLVPNGWGMFTAQGNSRMKAKANSMVKKLEKAKSYSDKVKAFEQYFKAYRSACNSTSEVMSEAGDTDVREQVWWFAVQAGKAVDVSENTLDDLWEDAR